MTNHPVSDIFPMLSQDELQALADDIREHGLREKIVTYNGKILDGRNRLAACKLAGVEPAFTEFDGDESGVLAYVVSANLKRRHLNESQRAMVAARVANLRDGERKDRRQGRSIDPPSSPAVSQREAASMLNVGEASVRRAARVQREGTPELQQEVETGKVSVARASRIAGLPKEQQNRIATAAPPVKTAVQHQHRQPQASNGQPSKAIRYSEEAINWLKKIPRNDPRRKEGYERVERFIRHNKN